MSDKNMVNLERLRDLIDTAPARQNIADDISCDVSLVTKHYNGQRTVTMEHLVKYAKYFNVSTDYLLGLTNTPVKLNDGSENALRISCDYTGLDEKAIEKLHNRSFNSDNIYKALASLMQSDKDKLFKYKNDDGIIALDKMKHGELSTMLTSYQKAAGDFVNSKYFDEILSSYVSQKEINESVITLLALDENKVSIDQLTDDELYSLYTNLTLNNIQDIQSLDLFKAQNNAMEFIKANIKYSSDDVMTVYRLSEYVEIMWDLREKGEIDV